MPSLSVREPSGLEQIIPEDRRVNTPELTKLIGNLPKGANPELDYTQRISNMSKQEVLATEKETRTMRR